MKKIKTRILAVVMSFTAVFCLTATAPVGTTEVIAKTTTETISFDPTWEYAGCAKITSGTATLYKVDSKKANGKTVCVNAGLGTEGGTSQKVLCHPDGTPKLVTGSTTAGATEAVAVGVGMTFNDGTKEPVATLNVAVALKRILLKAGYNVLMIRESNDVQLDNIARTLIANNCADIHIAIHYDEDSLNEDKGVFFCSIPEDESYRNMEPVKSWWQEHMKLGECAIEGLTSVGMKKWNDGKLDMDLTQTSFSTIPSINLEVGNQCSDLSYSEVKKIAKGIRIGVDNYFSMSENVYKHEPMENPKAAKDVIIDHYAVYGYSPRPSSERLGAFVGLGWSDKKLIEEQKQIRIDYHERVESELLEMVEDMKKKGKSIEKIARKVSARRNEMRLEEAERSGVLEETKASNLEKYGNENGPTADSLYEKYGSWETVAQKAFSLNIGMDVCLGLYDTYYDTYDVLNDLFPEN